jgi:hypothetical protein
MVCRCGIGYEFQSSVNVTENFVLVCVLKVPSRSLNPSGCRYWTYAKDKCIKNNFSVYLLTYLLHGAVYYLKSWLSLRLSKNFNSLWNLKVHYRAHKNPPLDSILNQPNPVRFIDPCLLKEDLNVILSPTPRSSQWFPTFGSPNQNPVNTSPLPHACYMSCPPHPPSFNHPNNIRWRIQAVKFIIM